MEGFVEREAWRVLRLLPQSSFSVDDLRHAGHLGLLEAEQRYDPRQGVPFTAFARHRVRGAMFDAAREAGASLRSSRARAALLAYEAAGPPPPAPPADASPEEARATEADALYGVIARVAVAFVLAPDLAAARDEAPTPEEETVLADGLARLRAGVELLGLEDREVIGAIYDLDAVGDSGQRLAARLGLSRSAVSRRHRRALDRLRRLVLQRGQGP
jgi:RNA polymerase sigma factor for flagellar operon FliA